MEQYVVFKSHDQLFGLPVTIVRRVVETNKFIPLPEVADYVLGQFSKADKQIIEQELALIPEALETLIKNGIASCSNFLGMAAKNK